MKKMSRLMAFAIVILSSGPVLQAETWKEQASRYAEQAEEMYRQRGRYGRETVDFLGRHKGKIAAGVGTAALGAAAYYAAPGIKEGIRLGPIVASAFPLADAVSRIRITDFIVRYNKGSSIDDLVTKFSVSLKAMKAIFQVVKDTDALTEEAKERLVGELSEYV